jgi:protein-S-isoprenylcysteine O-methyltransferase Ste14
VTPLAVRIALLVLWGVWFYPFLFRAPHRQKRESITVAMPTRVGLLFECAGIALACVFRLPSAPGWQRIVPALSLSFLATWMAFNAVKHLGKQFRVHAGLYADHELVQTGVYTIVRHPIYAALFAMLLCTMLLLTPWKWMPVSLALFLIGTEIRVRAEDGLLASRFGAKFEAYRKRVPAYLPFVR